MIQITLLFGVILIVVWYLRYYSKRRTLRTQTPSTDTKSKSLTKDPSPESLQPNNECVTYVAQHLRPDSSHMELLFYVATTPKQIRWGLDGCHKEREWKHKRTQYLKEQKQKDGGFDLNGMWDDGMEDDDVHKGIEIENEKELLKRQMNTAADGNELTISNIKLEGVDDHVLGIEWIKSILREQKQWPPSFLTTNEELAKMRFILSTSSNNNNEEEQTKLRKAINHEGVMRNLCMTMGRLNALVISNHPKLRAAGHKGLIDPTYFRNTIDYRHRTGILLECILRSSISLKSYRLAKTIIETTVMFKLGTIHIHDAKELSLFRDQMKHIYGGPKGVPDGIPRLSVESHKVVTLGEKEVVVDEMTMMVITVDRVHAEAFTRQKMRFCQQSNIPLKIGMQGYREDWWILLRGKKIDGSNEENKQTNKNEEEQQLKKEEVQRHKDPLLRVLNDKDIVDKFSNEQEENRLLCAWPLIISNMAMKKAEVKVKFRAPKIPGRYQLTAMVMSQEYLGCDQEIVVEVDILDRRKTNNDNSINEELTITK